MNNVAMRAKGGRLTKWKGRVASVAPSLFLGSTSILAPVPNDALADTISSPQRVPFVSSVDIDHTVTPSGTVIVDPLIDPALIEINLADYTSTLTNQGTLSGSAGNSSPHTGILLSGDLSGQVVNSGGIELGSGGGASFSALRGIEIQGAVSGNVSHASTIMIEQNATVAAIAQGISAGDISGQVASSGSIAIRSNGNTFGEADGIVLNAVSGGIENSGTIAIALDASAANVDGVFINGVTATGSANNSGDITINAAAQSSSLSADGIDLGLVAGTAINTGTISVTGIASTNARVQGVDLSDVSGTFENSGTILVTANGSTVNADGLNAGDISGQFSNSGTVSVNVMSLGSRVNARGIDLNAVDGSVKNSGAVSVIGVGSTAAALTGVYLDDLNGTVANSGNVTVAINGGSSIELQGIRLQTSTGDFSNSGQIAVTSSNTTSHATVYGIDAGRLNSGATLSNSGNISVQVMALDGSLLGYGVRTQNADGIVENSGDITISVVNSNRSFATGIGIDVSSVNQDARFSNSGNIAISASGRSGYGYGLQGSTISGVFENSGDIAINAAGDSSATAEGISAFRVQETGVVKNSGNIAISLGGEAPSYHTGVGITSFLLDGSIENSGNITVQSATSATSSADYAGLSSVALGRAGAIVNSGDITLSAVAPQADDAHVTGFEVINGAGSITNSGAMRLFAEANDDASAQGWLTLNFLGDGTQSGPLTVEANSQMTARANGISIQDLAGTLTQSGTITATANGTTDALATGFNVPTLSGTLTQTGDITAVATGSGSVQAFGLKLGTVNGTVASSGAINASSTGGAIAQASGISADMLNGILDVSGNITAISSGQAYAINLQGGEGTLNLVSSAAIDGVIRVSDHNVNLTHNGSSGVFRFQDDNIVSGTFTAQADSPNTLWASTGEGGASPTYIAVNGEDFADGSETPLALVGFMSGLLTELDRGTNQASGTVSTRGAGLSRTFNRPFLRFDTINISQDGTTSRVDANGLTAGLAGQTQEGRQFSFGLTSLDLDGHTGVTSLNASGLFLSGSYRIETGAAKVSFGMAIGQLDHTDTRDVSGGTAAVGDYDSNVLILNVSADHVFKQTDRGSWAAIGGISLGQQSSDGYAETGSLANAVVPDRTVNFGELSFGVRYKHDYRKGAAWASLSAVHSRVSGTSGFDVSVLGNSVGTGSSSTESDANAELSVGYQTVIGRSGQLNFQASTNLGGRTQEHALSGAYQIKF